MKKQKAKLLACLLAASCGVGCLGVGVAAIDGALTVPYAVSADAATNTATITSLTPLSSSNASLVQAYQDGMSKILGSWEIKFVFEENSGKGFLLNGTALTSYSIKQPNDFYIELGTSAAEGDILTIDGTFSCTSDGTTYSYTFSNCQLKYNGSAWETYVESSGDEEETPEEDTVTYTTYELGVMGLNSPSKDSSIAKNSQLYLGSSAMALPVQSWDYKFAIESGGLKVNGATATLNEMKSAPEGLFLVFTGVNVGDVVTLSGTFYEETNAVKYVIEESSFVWNGSIWVAYNASAEYTTYNVGKVAVANGSSATAVYFGKASGEAFEVTEGTWTEKLTYLAETGSVGITLNGSKIVMNDIKIPSNIYVGLGATAAENDELVISGTFYNETLKVKYVIEESKFTWNGTAWEGEATDSGEGETPEGGETPDSGEGEGETPVEYTTYELGVMTVGSDSRNANANAKSLYLTDENGNDLSEADSNWNTKFTFSSGGVKLDGDDITSSLGDIKNPGQLYIGLNTTVSAGQVVTVSGTLVNDDVAIKYVIEESKFTWNGSIWEVYEEKEGVVYTDYKVASIAAATGSNASALYIIPADGSDSSFGVGDWDNFYRFDSTSGDGLSLNGRTLTTTDIKQPGAIYIALGATAEAGDILKIDGAYYNDTTEKKIIFNNCYLKYNGTAWETYAPAADYTMYNVQKITVESASDASYVYAISADGSSFGTGDWDNVYTLEADTGNGITLNGTALTPNSIKQPGSFFIELGVTATEGDILVIDGAYYNDTTVKKIIFENCKLQYNGTTWETYIDIAIHEFASMELHANSTVGGAKDNNGVLYLKRADGEALPLLTWDEAFTVEKGGLTVNGIAVDLLQMNSTADGLYIKFDALNAGDVIAFGGTFYCENQYIKYVIEESKFTWTGSAWERYVEYETQEVGTLIINQADSSQSAVYLWKADMGDLNVNSWDYKFKFRAESGVGLLYNGETLNTDDIKSPNNSIYIGLGLFADEGGELTIGGTFYCIDEGVEYVIEKSSFVYTDGVWENKIDLVKADAKESLGEYRATFSDEDYYDTEVGALNAIVTDGKAAIDAAATEAEVAEALAAAKSALDEVMTITEADAAIDELKASKKQELAAYKNESDYRSADWAAIEEIIENASAEIDASTSVTAVKSVTDAAKAEMDAVKTAAQRDADEQEVADAKNELATYKSESDYKVAEWTQIQAIITAANAKIDDNLGNSGYIAEIVADAKNDIDAVKTAAQVDADEKFAADAKSELDAYKNESEYRAQEWTEIQAIITAAKAEIDENLGDEAAINSIVADAKEDMDEVLKTDDAIAADFAALKESARQEVRTHYTNLDHSKYTDEQETEIYGYVEEALTAIENATTEEEVNSAVSQYKTKVAGIIVEQDTTPSTGDEVEEESSGCSGSVGAGLAAGSVMLAAAIAVLRKKKED